MKRLEIRVTPRAKKDGIIGYIDSILYLRIANIPRKNRVNIRIIAYLSEITGINKSRIELHEGGKSRKKILIIYTDEDVEGIIKGICYK